MESVEWPKCLRALFVSNPADDRAYYISFKRQVIAEPFAWVAKTDTYTSWTDASSGSGLLWLTGEAGTGKTTLAILLTQELEKPPPKAVWCSFTSARVETRSVTCPPTYFEALGAV